MSTELHDHPGEVRELPLNIIEIAGLKKGDSIRLQKIDPETGEHLEQKFPMDGWLEQHWKGKHPAAVKVGQSIYIDHGSSHTASSTSAVQKIVQMSDGSYVITTRSSTYRLTVLETNAQGEKKVPTVTTEQEVDGKSKSVKRLLIETFLRFRP